MTRGLLLLMLLPACHEPVALPAKEPAGKTALWRANTALDSLRVALDDIYSAGGRVSAVWILAGDSAFIVQLAPDEPTPVVSFSYSTLPWNP